MKTLTLKKLFEEINININNDEMENFIKLNLSDDDRLYKAIIMKYKENKSYQEIGDYFQISNQRAANLIKHALWLLKRRYEYPFDILFTTRASTALIRFGIKNLEDLSKISQEELLEVRGIGKEILIEIIKVMEEKGLQFKGNCKCGEKLSWNLDDEGTLNINGEGDMYDYTYSFAPWYSNRTMVKKVIVNDGVTTISDKAFNGCINLRNIVLPDTIKYFGAFNL